MSEASVEVGSVKALQKASIVVVDDEERFRKNLCDRLRLRGFVVQDTGDGEEAIRLCRQSNPDVVILDRKMPGMSGEEVLKEIKKITPAVQVVMLTGHGSIESAAEAGRLQAFAYLQKPCETDELLQTIERACREKGYALAKLGMQKREAKGFWGWLKGTHNLRPGFMFLGGLLFALLVLMPTPESMLQMLSTPKIGQPNESIAGHADYRRMKVGQTIADYYGELAKIRIKERGPDGKETTRPPNAEEAAQKAKAMIGVLVVAGLFWATGALPVGFTALLVGLLMYLFGIFTADGVAKAYAKDAVIFIMGVLALAAGVAKTGLDKRIGLVLLGTSRSIPAYLFIFCPLLALAAAFLSEHALVAFITPIVIVVYTLAVRAAKITGDKALAVLLILSVCLVANHGGPGSPAAGGRNAVMVGILSDYGTPISFGQWVKYGMPFVPVAVLGIALYFWLRFRKSLKIKKLNIAEIVKKESVKLGKMNFQEYVTAAVLALVVALWISAGETAEGIGMGGPALIGLILLAAFRVLVWQDVNRIPWDVVMLYAAASAMGAGLASTGAALWLARSFVDILPDFLSHGAGLAVASSLITGTLTQFMSDGATVSAVGPITVPMAAVSGTHPWMVGLATAFASSFANCLIIGTPNNAIAYSLAKDYDTGEQLVTLSDFLKHGLAVTLIAFAVLWGWTILVYWNWIGFPA